MSKKTTARKLPGEDLKARELRERINEFLSVYSAKGTPAITLEQPLTASAYQAAATAIINCIEADFHFPTINNEFNKEFCEILDLFGCPYSLRHSELVQIGVKNKDATFLYPLYWLTQVIDSYAQLANNVSEELFPDECRMKAKFFAWVCHKYSHWIEKGKGFMKNLGSKLQKSFQDEINDDTEQLIALDAEIQKYEQEITVLNTASQLGSLKSELTKLQEDIQSKSDQAEKLTQEFRTINEEIEEKKKQSDQVSQGLKAVNQEYNSICEKIKQMGKQPDEFVNEANTRISLHKKFEEESMKVDESSKRLQEEEKEIQSQFLVMENLSEDYNCAAAEIKKKFQDLGGFRLNISDLSEEDITVLQTADQMKINPNGETMTTLFGVDIIQAKNLFQKVEQLYRAKENQDIVDSESEIRQLKDKKEMLSQKQARKQEIIDNLTKDISGKAARPQRKKVQQFSKDDFYQLQNEIKRLGSTYQQLRSDLPHQLQKAKSQCFSFQGKVEHNLQILVGNLHALLDEF